MNNTLIRSFVYSWPVFWPFLLYLLFFGITICSYIWLFPGIESQRSAVVFLIIFALPVLVILPCIWRDSYRELYGEADTMFRYTQKQNGTWKDVH